MIVIEMYQRFAQVRGEVKTKAQGIVLANYGIKLSMGPFKIAERVEELLKRRNYTFLDPDTVSAVSFQYEHKLTIYSSGLNLSKTLPTLSWLGNSGSVMPVPLGLVPFISGLTPFRFRQLHS